MRVSMAKRAIHLRDDFEAQGLSNLAWAVAKLRFHHPELMETLGDRGCAKASEFNAQAISSMA